MIPNVVDAVFPTSRKSDSPEKEGAGAQDLISEPRNLDGHRRLD